MLLSKASATLSQLHSEDQWRLTLFVALGLRLALVLYADWHDEHLLVKYTDVDYHVFTDAAEAVYHGGSPFERRTYRYTPLLAWMLIPNLCSFGKLIFVLSDLGVGWLLKLVLRARGVKERVSIGWVCAWLFHPYSVNISTRGNADSLICLLILATGLSMLKRQYRQAAIFFGVGVHFRIFPIIFAPTFLLSIGWQPRQLFEFSVLSGGIFFLFLGIFYYLYGFPFVYETYLYHLVRTDNRHNFSVYFYSLYLQYSQPAGFILGLAAFMPQIIAQVTLVSVLRFDLISCMCLQVMSFVVFNKVCTAQYFTWYTGLLPVPLSTLHAKNSRLPVWILGLAVIWLISQGAWLSQAYLLEFKAQNTFLRIWSAGILFFIVNVGIIGTLANVLIRSS